MVFFTMGYQERALYDEVQRVRLDAAVRAAGGVTYVAAQAQLDASNVTKFLKRGAGLSEEKAARLELWLGRPGGQADPYQVVVLRPRKVDNWLRQAMTYYFPAGAIVARAPWTGRMAPRLKKMLTADFTCEVYALRDASYARVLILLPAGLQLPEDLWVGSGVGLSWALGSSENAVLDLGDVKPWVGGTVSSVAFDDAWPSDEVIYTAEDLVSTAKRLGLSWQEAIRRLTHGR